MAAVDDSSAGLPVAYLIFREPNFDGAGNVVSATSQGGAQFGLVEPSTANRGQTYAYQEGTPTSTPEISLWTQGGAPGISGSYVHRLSTEGSASDWKAQNALTIPIKNHPMTTSAKLYAHGTVYSRLYDRLVSVWLDTATTIQVRYVSADGHLSSATSTTITITDGDVATPSGGLDVEELPDGTLILAVQVLRRLNDVDLYTSSNGGTSWSLSQRGISQREASGVGYGGGAGQNTLRRSGDWLRMVFLASGAGLLTVGMYTMVSPDRGASWENIGATLIHHWTSASADYFVGAAPFDIIGLDDIAGTFLLASTNQTGSEVKIYVAQGADAWTSVAALDFDYSDYATTAKCKGVWFARGMDRIWLYMWIEGTDASEVVCRIAPIDGVMDSENWTTLGTISAFSGVLRYGPHRPRAVFAGNRFVWSAGVQDATVAGAADALIAGHWTMTLGGMDPYPLAPSNYSNGWYLSSYAATFKLLAYNWQPPVGLPTASGLTPYTQVTAGAVTTTDNKNRVTLTAGTTGHNYYALSITPGSASETWGNSANRGFTFCARIKVSGERGTAVDDNGMRVIAPSTHTVTTTGFDFSIRLQLATIVLVDNVTGGTLASIVTTDAASDCEIRATISGTSLWFKRRLVSLGATGAWTLSGPYTLTSGTTIAGQRFRIGVIGAPVPAGTSTIDIYEWEIGKASDTLSQRGDLTKPDDMFGTLMTTDPVLVANGAWIGWAGPGSAVGDTYTAALEYVRGYSNLSVSSPRYYWESTSLISNAIVFNARTDSGSAGRNQLNAIMLIGTTDLSCTLELHTTNSWGSPSVSVTLSAVLWSNLKVANTSGNLVQLTTVSGTFEAWPGELVGQYLRFTSGTGAGKTFLIIADQDIAGSRWLAVESSSTSMAGHGVLPDDTVTIFTDRMTYLSDTFWQYQYFRLVFPDVSSVANSLGTATGTHRLGAMIPGHWVRLSRNDGLLDARFTDNEEHVYARSKSSSNVDHRVQKGPSARSMTLSLVNGFYPDNPNSARGELPRQICDMVRTMQDGATLPVGLILDSLYSPFRHVTMYGTLGLAGTKLEHPHPIATKGPDGKFYTPTSVDLGFEEDV